MKGYECSWDSWQVKLAISVCPLAGRGQDTHVDYPLGLCSCLLIKASLLPHVTAELFSLRRYCEILTPLPSASTCGCDLIWKQDLCWCNQIEQRRLEDFSDGPVTETPWCWCRGPGSISGQGTRSRMPQLKILCATTKTWWSQIGARDKELACQCRRYKRRGFDPWIRKVPWRRAWQVTPVFLPEESHGQRSLAGYSP